MQPRRRAIACPSCGTPLTHQRIALDPIYKLPLLTCPNCSMTIVRRTRELALLRRTIVLWARSLFALGWRAALVGPTLLIVAAFASDSLVRHGTTPAGMTAAFHAITSFGRLDAAPGSGPVIESAVELMAVCCVAGFIIGAIVRHPHWLLAWIGSAAIVGVVSGVIYSSETTNTPWHDGTGWAIFRLSLLVGLPSLAMSGLGALARVLAIRAWKNFVPPRRFNDLRLHVARRPM